MSNRTGRPKDFDYKNFTVGHIADRLKMPYWKALQLVTRNEEHDFMERVDHRGDKRERRYKIK